MIEGRPAKSLLALDLLRFAAAGLVMSFHFLATWPRDTGSVTMALMAGVPREQLAGPISGNGWIGVPIFFVLSGYVIARSARGATGAAFAWRRWLRLWPSALLCSTITAVALWWGGAEVNLAAWSSSAMLWPSASQIDPSYWTLGIECAFYLLVSLLLAAGRFRQMQVATALLTVSAAFWVGALLHGIQKLPEIDRFQELLLLRHGALFAIGMMIEHGHSGQRAPIARIALGIAIGLAVVAHSCIRAAAAHGTGLHFASASAIFLGGVAIVALAPKLQPSLERLRLDGAIVTLGLATYPLYLIHQVVGHAAIGALFRAGASLSVAIGAASLSMVAVALVIARWVEPALRTEIRGVGERLITRAMRPARSIA